jgi:hypothetical protein
LDTRGAIVGTAAALRLAPEVGNLRKMVVPAVVGGDSERALHSVCWLLEFARFTGVDVAAFAGTMLAAVSDGEHPREQQSRLLKCTGDYVLRRSNDERARL